MNMWEWIYGTPTLGLYQPRALCAVAPHLLPGLRGLKGISGSPPAKVWAAHHGWCTACRLPVAYVAPSRLAARRTSSLNSSSARVYQDLDVATLRRFTPATGGGGGEG